MSDSLGVLETCRLVAERSEKVRIDQKFECGLTRLG